MTEKLKILETLFLPDWGSVVIICEEARVFIELARGEFLEKHEIKDRFPGYNNEFYKQRDDLFDELYQYYKENYS